jgi:hypothetical protein
MVLFHYNDTCFKENRKSFDEYGKNRPNCSKILKLSHRSDTFWRLSWNKNCMIKSFNAKEIKIHLNFTSP